jgi:hypothetical protein
LIYLFEVSYLLGRYSLPATVEYSDGETEKEAKDKIIRNCIEGKTVSRILLIGKRKGSIK